MKLQQKTDIPEGKDTIVMLRQLSTDDKIRQEAFYRERQLHDEASALGSARREGEAIGLAKGETIGMVKKEADIILKFHQKGKTPEQIADDLDISINKVIAVINNKG